MISFYHKIHEVVGLLAELVGVQVLTDTTVLHLSTLGVSPFFVENVSELQLAALKLVTGVKNEQIVETFQINLLLEPSL